MIFYNICTLYIFCIAKNAHLGTSKMNAKQTSIIEYHMHIVIIRVFAIPKFQATLRSVFLSQWSNVRKRIKKYTMINQKFSASKIKRKFFVTLIKFTSNNLTMPQKLPATTVQCTFIFKSICELKIGHINSVMHPGDVSNYI